MKWKKVELVNGLKKQTNDDNSTNSCSLIRRGDVNKDKFPLLHQCVALKDDCGLPMQSDVLVACNERMFFLSAFVASNQLNAPLVSDSSLDLIKSSLSCSVTPLDSNELSLFQITDAPLDYVELSVSDGALDLMIKK